MAVFRFEKGRLRPADKPVVEEFPLRITVNGKEIATLIGSPHQLNYLTAGFLRLQGFIESAEDILSLGICQDFGAAAIRIRGEVPPQLRPVLTSGCGTGISFSLPAVAPRDDEPSRLPTRFPVQAVLDLMKDLSRKAENYRSHGGIHSAAVGDGQRLLLYSEDLGRHNTLDRLAGEALFKGLDLAGKMLVTSGRVSTEMISKAARLGITLVASRTSPTDLAVQMARKAGITLIGYVRGEEFTVYAGAERLTFNDSHSLRNISPAPGQGRIPGITGVILAGGESRRMGCDKSLLPVRGARFIDHIFRCLDGLFDEVLIVTNSPGLYHDLPCRTVPDIYYGKGSLAGIHSGLCHARNDRIFVVACDMPLISESVIRQICAQASRGDVVIPQSATGPEPLHALYAKSCIPSIETVLDGGQRRIVRFFPMVAVHEIPHETLAPLDRSGHSFRNINTPQEYFGLREGEKNLTPLPETARKTGA